MASARNGMEEACEGCCLAGGFSGEMGREALVHHESIFGYLARVVVGGHFSTERGADMLHAPE